MVGVWYGKGPGLDRASDAIRHAAMYGAHPRRRRWSWSATTRPPSRRPSLRASERSLAALGMPVFFPRNAEEIITFGLYGVALSRASGCWSAMKIVADVADGLWTLDRDFADLDIVTRPKIEWEGQPWTYRQRLLAAPTGQLLAEADLYGPRWAMVEAFNAANEIDRIEVDPADAWLGSSPSAPPTTPSARHCSTSASPTTDLQHAGIRILRVGMPYPLGADKVRGRSPAAWNESSSSRTRAAFVETQVKDILYGTPAHRACSASGTAAGEPLIPADGELTAARLLAPLRGCSRTGSRG